MFPCGTYFSGVFDEIFIKVIQFHKPPPPCPEKFLVAHLHSGITLFAKRSIVDVWQCSEYLCLDNCSEICTVTLCCVLHQTHSEFWHIHRCFFRYMLAYSIIFNAIEAYSRPCEIQTRHIQNPAIGYYSGIFRALCNACIRRNLAHSKSQNIQNLSIIAFRRILRTLSY